MKYEEYIALGRTGRIENSIAPCGLVCELCSERTHCKGCWECSDFPCGKDMQDVSQHGVRLIAFTEYIKRNSRKALAERLAENEKNGIIYHRDPVNYTGDYDGYSEVEEVISLLESGEKNV